MRKLQVSAESRYHRCGAASLLQHWSIFDSCGSDAAKKWHCRMAAVALQSQVNIIRQNIRMGILSHYRGFPFILPGLFHCFMTIVYKFRTKNDAVMMQRGNCEVTVQTIQPHCCAPAAALLCSCSSTFAPWPATSYLYLQNIFPIVATLQQRSPKATSALASVSRTCSEGHRCAAAARQ